VRWSRPLGVARDRSAWIPGHADKHVAILANLAVDVDLFAEGTFRRRAHAVNQMWSRGNWRRQHQRG
jgi:hypothetical protein